MTLYRVSFYFPLKFDIEVVAEDAVFAIEYAIDRFWDDIPAYVDICPEDAEVKKIEDEVD